MDCYPTTIFGKDFLLWLSAVISNEAKMLPLKIGLHKFRSILCLILLTTNGKGFSYFAKNSNQVYNLLPHHYWQGFFALDCCSVTSNEAKVLPPKMGLPSLRVPFNQVRYPLFGKRLLPPG